MRLYRSPRVKSTHGHLDHTGYLPKLVKDGFKGPIFCTPPTKDVMQIILDDSANLQMHLQMRGFQHEHSHAPPPYYDADDVAKTMALVQTAPLHQAFTVAGVMQATYSNAGHILGSAFVTLQIDGRRVVFSGDVGRYGRPLLFDPEPLGAIDDIICESTYGDRIHPPDSNDDLRDAMLAGLKLGGAIIIPAFAVERTQDLLLAIATIQQSEPRLAKLPIHLDSPMAEKVDDLFEKYPNDHKPIPRDSAGTPFGVKNLTVHVTAEQSMQLNTTAGPHVIISASGMASGGRILHHLHNHIADPNATIVFCGYQSIGTLGNLLINGAHTVKIYGDQLLVQAKIVNIGGFSGHADESDFKRWFGTCTTKPHLYAVHGEPASSAALATFAQTLGWKADAGHRGSSITL
jgi:metallo-beta-lactamase family protein